MIVDDGISLGRILVALLIYCAGYFFGYSHGHGRRKPEEADET